MEKHYKEKERQRLIKLKTVGQHDELSQKFSIMQGSLSRERIESIDQKGRADFKGPGYYNP